jgi:hypothetical protein
MQNNQQDEDQFLQNKDEIYIGCYDRFLQLKVNNNMLRSFLTMVNYNMLWLFLIIKGQLQHIAISSTRLRSVLTIKGQLQHITIISDI